MLKYKPLNLLKGVSMRLLYIILLVSLISIGGCDLRPAWAEKVSWYGNESIVPKWKGFTANGEKFDENAYTCAVPKRSMLGRRYKVSYEGKSVIVRANDTGSFAKYGRTLDLSKASFKALAPLKMGVINAKVEEVN